MSPGRIDVATVQRHLLALDEALSELGRHTGREVAALEADLSERWSVERGLQIAVQSLLDIATHLAAASGVDAPDYGSALDALGRLRFVEAELAGKLRPLAGFRNALVRGYLKLDLVRVHGVLNQHLDELREFARQITAGLPRS